MSPSASALVAVAVRTGPSWGGRRKRDRRGRRRVRRRVVTGCAAKLAVAFALHVLQPRRRPRLRVADGDDRVVGDGALQRQRDGVGRDRRGAGERLGDTALPDVERRVRQRLRAVERLVEVDLEGRPVDRRRLEGRRGRVDRERARRGEAEAAVEESIAVRASSRCRRRARRRRPARSRRRRLRERRRGRVEGLQHGAAEPLACRPRSESCRCRSGRSPRKCAVSVGFASSSSEHRRAARASASRREAVAPLAIEPFAREPLADEVSDRVGDRAAPGGV